MRVAYVTPEAVPFSESSSIGDVAGHLPRYLSRRDLEVTVITPLYKDIEAGRHSLAHRLDKLEVMVGGKKEIVAVLEGKMAGGKTNALFMDHPSSFHRDHYYGDYEDNHRRFYLFAAAALQLIEKYKLDPQVIHLNSWASAIFAPLLRQNADEKLSKTPLLFSLYSSHRERTLAADQAKELNLEINGLGSDEGVPFIALAAHHAQLVTTLSPRYAEKLKASGEFGQSVIGVVGGVNPETWNPETSRNLRQNYETATIGKRVQNKFALQESLGLPLTDTKPLVGMFGPFHEHSGIDLLLDTADDWTTRDLQFVFFGDEADSRLKALVEKHPHLLLRAKPTRAAMCRALAGLDAVVFPEREAPSKILQLRALRYGAFPLAHATDALADTLVDFDPISGSGTALLFDDYTREGLVGAFDRLRILYPTRQRNQLIYNTMVQNYSWEEMAMRYEAIYRELDAAANPKPEAPADDESEAASDEPAASTEADLS